MYLMTVQYFFSCNYQTFKHLFGAELCYKRERFSLHLVVKFIHSCDPNYLKYFIVQENTNNRCHPATRINCKNSIYRIFLVFVCLYRCVCVRVHKYTCIIPFNTIILFIKLSRMSSINVFL